MIRRKKKRKTNEYSFTFKLRFIPRSLHSASFPPKSQFDYSMYYVCMMAVCMCVCMCARVFYYYDWLNGQMSCERLSSQIIKQWSFVGGSKECCRMDHQPWRWMVLNNSKVCVCCENSVNESMNECHLSRFPLPIATAIWFQSKFVYVQPLLNLDLFNFERS